MTNGVSLVHVGKKSINRFGGMLCFLFQLYFGGYYRGYRWVSYVFGRTNVAQSALMLSSTVPIGDWIEPMLFI